MTVPLARPRQGAVGGGGGLALAALLLLLAPGPPTLRRAAAAGAAGGCGDTRLRGAADVGLARLRGGAAAAGGGYSIAAHDAEALMQGGMAPDFLPVERADSDGGEAEEESADASSDSADAEWIYREALDANPADVRAHGSLADVLHRKGDVDGAVHSLYVALALEPGNRLTLYSQAMLLLRRAAPGDADAATGLLARAVEADPASVPSLHMYGRVLHSLHGRLEEAEDMYRRALVYEPKRGDILSDYGALLEARGSDSQAVRGMYKRAALLAPSHADALSNYARVLEEGVCMTHARTHIRTHARARTHTCTHANTHTHTHTHTCTCIHACIYTHTHARTRALAHTHTHTHTRRSRRRRQPRHPRPRTPRPFALPPRTCGTARSRTNHVQPSPDAGFRRHGPRGPAGGHRSPRASLCSAPLARRCRLPVGALAAGVWGGVGGRTRIRGMHARGVMGYACMLAHIKPACACTLALGGRPHRAGARDVRQSVGVGPAQD